VRLSPWGEPPYRTTPPIVAATPRYSPECVEVVFSEVREAWVIAPSAGLLLPSPRRRVGEGR
jgi:hypothetical protein